MTDAAYIAKFIYAAQAASDRAKGIINLNVTYNSEKGYGVKPIYELKAINHILRHPEAGFTFCVIKDYDQNGYLSYIVYFQYKDEEGKRKQISFHNPANASYYFERYVKKSFNTEWSGKLYDSRANCVNLQKRFGKEW